jgi:DNA sulfur modification protein DndC
MGRSLEVVRQSRYQPTVECLKRLNQPWIASYSGGKDSTSLVTWLEWLRRSGQVKIKQPRLVLSDTGVEYPFLQEIAQKLMSRLQECGWECTEVRPRVEEKLYCQIFGRGLSPVHPGNRKFMRWCTRSTKVDPMLRFRYFLGSQILVLNGMRWGESKNRDGKLVASGCSAGGECGTNLQGVVDGEKLFSPIINWTTCYVVDWLMGAVDEISFSLCQDLFKITQDLVTVYGVKRKIGLFGPPEIESSLRYGCIGCPAVGVGALVKRTASLKKIGAVDSRADALTRIYGIWQEVYKSKNRLGKYKKGTGKWMWGPIAMEARKQFFAEIMEVQRKAGVVLITKEDEKFIKQCWKNKVYPKGWSEADEINRGK